MLITKNFNATLNNKLSDQDSYLPLSVNDMNRLVSLLGAEDGNYTYLTIRDRLNTEIVKAIRTCVDGQVLLERGMGDTEPKNFPFGSCVEFEASVPVVKDLICNYDCCEGDCPCEPVSVAGFDLPPATVGIPYEAHAVFLGDTPMAISISGLPDWASAFVGANYLRITGTPNTAGSFGVSVAATNCSGTAIVTQNDTLLVTAP